MTHLNDPIPVRFISWSCPTCSRLHYNDETSAGCVHCTKCKIIHPLDSLFDSNDVIRCGKNSYSWDDLADQFASDVYAYAGNVESRYLRLMEKGTTPRRYRMYVVAMVLAEMPYNAGIYREIRDTVEDAGLYNFKITTALDCIDWIAAWETFTDKTWDGKPYTTTYRQNHADRFGG